VKLMRGMLAAGNRPVRLAARSVDDPRDARVNKSFTTLSKLLLRD
jgi:hypothetical protein